MPRHPPEPIRPGRSLVTQPEPVSRRARVGELVLLAGILAVAAACRAFLHGSGLPGEALPRHDEVHYVDRVVAFLLGDWDVRSFINPTLQAYLLYALTLAVGLVQVALGHAASLAAFSLSACLDPTPVTLAGRALAATAAVASVAVLHRIGRRLFGARVAALAALALAVDLVHARRSVLAGNETTMVLGVLLAFDALLSWRRRPTPWRGVLCGALAGLACAVKYNGAAIVAPLALACLLPAEGASAPEREAPPRRRGRWVPLLLVPVVFLLATPQALVHPEELLTDVRTQADYLDEGFAPVDVSTGSGWLAYAGAFADENAGTPFALACALGIGLALAQLVRRREARLALVLAAALPSFLFLGSGGFVRMRFLLPALPFVLLLGAWAVDRVLARIEERLGLPVVPRGLLGAAVGLGLLAWPGVATWRAMDAEYGGPDPRRALVLWARHQIAPGEVVAELDGSPRMRVLASQERLEAEGLLDAPLADPELAALLAAHLATTPRSVPLQDLLRRARSAGGLLRLMQRQGLGQLLIVLRIDQLQQLPRLPELLPDETLAACDYWPELVDRLLKWRRRGRGVLSDDGAWGAVLLTRH